MSRATGNGKRQATVTWIPRCYFCWTMSNISNRKQLFGNKKFNSEQQILLPATKATQGQQPKSNSNKKVLSVICDWLFPNIVCKISVFSGTAKITSKATQGRAATQKKLLLAHLWLKLTNYSLLASCLCLLFGLYRWSFISLASYMPYITRPSYQYQRQYNQILKIVKIKAILHQLTKV